MTTGMEWEPVEQVELDSNMSITVANSQTLDALFEKVYHDSGHDFREYKRGTVTRRLQRRLYAGIK